MSRADALRWSVERGHEDELLFDRLSDAALPTVHPDEVVARAIDLMLANDMGRLPVVARADGRLVGLLTRKHLLQVRRLSVAHEEERQRIFSPAGRNRKGRRP